MKVAFLRDNENNSLFASAGYTSHGDYPKVYSHPCIGVTGAACPSCAAGVPKTPRYLLGLIDLSDGSKKVFEVSKTQYNGIKTSVADYTEDGSVFELAFKLSKSGTGTSTVLSVTPILKPTDADKQLLPQTETPVSETFFDDALGDPDADYIAQKIAGYKKDETTVDSAGSSEDPTKQF